MTAQLSLLCLCILLPLSVSYDEPSFCSNKRLIGLNYNRKSFFIHLSDTLYSRFKDDIFLCHSWTNISLVLSASSMSSFKWVATQCRYLLLS
jgi:hypothetical protein